VLAAAAATVSAGLTVGATSAAAVSGATLYVATDGTANPACSAASPCDLSSAVALANGDVGDTLILADGTYNPGSGLSGGVHQTISTAMTLQAAPSTFPILDGGGTGDILTVTSTGDLSIIGLTVQHAGSSRTAIHNSGTLTLDDSNVTNSNFGLLSDVGSTTTVTDTTVHANFDDGFNNRGTATIRRSAFDNNDWGLVNDGTATADHASFDANKFNGIENHGGAILTVDASNVTGSGDGIFNQGTATVSDSTFSDNDYGLANNAMATVTNSTFITNSQVGLITGDGASGSLLMSTLAGNGSGIATGAGVDLSVGADVVAGNTPDCSGSFPSDKGYDIDGDGTCSFNAAGSVSGSPTIAASLAGPGNFGGPTPTVRLVPGSPAIDLVTDSLSDGTPVCGTPDQRGKPRPVETCDADSFETHPTRAAPDVTLSVWPAGGVTAGQTVLLTAVVAGPEGKPTGTFNFTAGGTSIGGCNAVPVDVDGTAECPTTNLPIGSDWLAAHYSGDPLYTRGVDTIGGYQVSRATPDVELMVSPPGGSTYGGTLTLTAAVFGDAGPATGSVRFTDDGTALPGCVAVPLDGGGAQCTTNSLHAGSYDLRAHYSGGSGYGAAADEIPAYVVGRAVTHVALTVHPGSLSATVSPVAPATGTPTGQVTFTVDGTPVGTTTMIGGVAKLTMPVSGAHGVGAEYTGDGNFQPAVGSTATRNPKLTAKVTSSTAKTSYGWYRTPVTITFTCTAGTGTITTTCPAPVQLSANKANQSVTRTIYADDGGLATLTVGPINIDQVPPTVAVTPDVKGGSYPAAQTLTCVGSDALSGIATCNVSQTFDSTHHVEHYTATAKDEAGNATTIHGSYSITG
jgi:hypothetical protein